MKYAVVVGASSGLGREACRQLALEQNVDEIWLIARREERLKELASTLPKPSKIFAIDICNYGELIPLIDAHEVALSNGNTLTWLVLAAGRGIPSRFDDKPEYLSTINLNIEALTHMASFFLPYLKGNALLFSSVAAFLPQPGFAVYAASKSYVLSLSRALNCEFKNATITAVCPNPVETEFFLQGDNQREISRIKSIGVESAEKVISTAIKRSKKGKDISISSPIAKLINFFAKILPHSWILKLGQNVKFFES